MAVADSDYRHRFAPENAPQHILGNRPRQECQGDLVHGCELVAEAGGCIARQQDQIRFLVLQAGRHRLAADRQATRSIGQADQAEQFFICGHLLSAS